MSAGCACVWSEMIYNLSPVARLAVVEEQVRSILPQPGEWAERREWTVILEPWDRSYIGCRAALPEGPAGPCAIEYSWLLVSCSPVDASN